MQFHCLDDQCRHWHLERYELLLVARENLFHGRPGVMNKQVMTMVNRSSSGFRLNPPELNQRLRCDYFSPASCC